MLRHDISGEIFVFSSEHNARNTLGGQLNVIDLVWGSTEMAVAELKSNQHMTREICANRCSLTVVSLSQSWCGAIFGADVWPPFPTFWSGSAAGQ